MKLTHKDGLAFWQFDLLLNENIPHGSFLRHGGESIGSYHSLNFSYDAGDLEKRVTQNRKKITQTLQIPDPFTIKLEHGNKIYHYQAPSSTPSCDAVITDSKDVSLLITHADCQAALFYDPVTQVIGAVHAGWRGNVQQIYTETIAYLKKKYHVNPSNLLVAISPSLGPTCAEFINYKKELPESFWRYQEKENHFNLWEIAKDELKRSGILAHHIEIAEICTASQTEDYFSYRKEKITGRLGTIISLSRHGT